MTNLLHILKNINVITQKGQINKQVKIILNKNPETFKILLRTTDFLPETAALRERVHCVQSNITSLPTCKKCSLPVSFNVAKGKYNNYCPNVGGKSCAAKDEELQEKRTQTLICKYGVDNPSKNTSIREKVVKTNLERYGGVAPMSNEEVKKKSQTTNLTRYGVTNPASLQKIKDKRFQTTKQKYGAKTFAESLLPVESVNLLNNEQWLVEQYVFHNKSMKQISQELNIGIFSVRRAIKKFSITRDFSHLDIDLDSHIPTYYLSNKQWLVEHYLHRNISKTQIAKSLNVNMSYVHQWCLKHKIEKNNNICSFSTSQAEGDILNFLQNICPHLDIKTNVKTVVPPFELDIYIPQYNLAIEYNGVFWHSEINGGKDKKYHLNKLNKCQKQNIRLIQVWSSEWGKKQEIVKSRLSTLLNQNLKIFARKCQVQEISSKDARTFLNNTHIQGFQGGSTHVGLIHDGDIVAIMTFGKSRYVSGKCIELIRYSNKLFTNVVGGASKLFKYYVLKYNPQTIISYSDKRWNTGRLYEILDFSYIKSSTPNYFYFKVDSDTDKLYSRISFQKHKLSQKLVTFDESFSEWQNMQSNGYDRIWDCGNDAYVWEIQKSGKLIVSPSNHNSYSMPCASSSATISSLVCAI